MHNSKRTRLSYGITVIVLVAAIFGFGYYFGSKDVQAETPTVTATSGDLSQFWKIWQILDEKYPDAEKITRQERIWGAMKGLVDSFNDPYTMYFDPKEAQQFEDSISGEFSGVGIEIGTKDEVLTVIAPVKDSPADKAGIKSGDQILEIDGITTQGMSTDIAISKIRGEKGTTVTLTIFHALEKKSTKVPLVRDTISVPSLETEIKDGAFIISFHSFSATSSTDFKKAIKDFGKSNTSNLIIDLRGNPGGYLEASVDIASWFVPQGKPIVIEDFGDPALEHAYRSKGYVLPKKPSEFIVLVDGGSASASEILAGALQEYHIAKLVGTQTYGKGSVQELINLSDESALKVTVAKWLTPNRVSISEKGVTPDVIVELPENLKEGEDPQFKKAIELMK